MSHTTVPATWCCSGCGSLDAGIVELISRHAFSQGLVYYTRCACGALQVRYPPSPYPARSVIACRRADAATNPRR